MIIDGYCTCGVERETQLNAAELLDRMAATGVARAVIAPEDRGIAVGSTE